MGPFSLDPRSGMVRPLDPLLREILESGDPYTGIMPKSRFRAPRFDPRLDPQTAEEAALWRQQLQPQGLDPGSWKGQLLKDIAQLIPEAGGTEDQNVYRANNAFMLMQGMPGAGAPGVLAANAGGRRGPLSPPDLLGRYATTTPGRIVNKTAKEGGYSVHLPTGEIPGEGLMMGRYANIDPRNLVTDTPLTREQLRAVVAKNRAVLSGDDAYLGTWRDPETGKTYVDIVRRFQADQLRQATKYGERTAQKAGYNVGAGETFPVESWEKFVRSPEFRERLAEMRAEGRGYLSQHPAKEWWDMHGGPFERVYGAENARPLAGFIASTAPNTAPRANLQTASEYMRRQIMGEPILQPGYRVPESMMTRLPGGQIGMELNRGPNLVKSARGEVEALRQDKVREEAMALLGDPRAVVLDRHWARLAEDPSRGIYTAAKEGLVEPGKQYAILKAEVSDAARISGRDPRDFSADVWTGIRERIKNTSELYGQKFQGSRIWGESKSYADHFEDLISDKAKHLGISKQEMESRLRRGDATLLSLIGASPFLAPIFSEVVSQQSAGRGSTD